MNQKFSRKLIAMFSGMVLLVSILVQAVIAEEAKPDIKNTLNGLTTSGPYVHENLSIFLLHGKDTVEGKTFITLEEALNAKKAVLHETGNVNKLSIENLSSNTHIYIQSGDIVKGGKQDRVISLDMIIQPNSGKIPLSAFCVEQGRWKNRGNEAVNQFASSYDQLNSKKLKLAAKSRRSQSEVWKEVAKSQKNLENKVGRSVQSGQSATSLQLTLEDKDLKAIVNEYTKKLSPKINLHKDVVGYAFAINGEFNSSDIYGSSVLFNKLWPKLIKASAVEAIAAKEKGKHYPSAKLKDIEISLEDALNGKKTEKKVGQSVNMITHESDKNVLFDTYDIGLKEAQPIHRNIISK